MINAIKNFFIGLAVGITSAIGIMYIYINKKKDNKKINDIIKRNDKQIEKNKKQVDANNKWLNDNKRMRNSTAKK